MNMFKIRKKVRSGDTKGSDGSLSNDKYQSQSTKYVREGKSVFQFKALCPFNKKKKKGRKGKLLPTSISDEKQTVETSVSSKAAYKCRWDSMVAYASGELGKSLENEFNSKNLKNTCCVDSGTNDGTFLLDSVGGPNREGLLNQWRAREQNHENKKNGNNNYTILPIQSIQSIDEAPIGRACEAASIAASTISMTTSCKKEELQNALNRKSIRRNSLKPQFSNPNSSLYLNNALYRCMSTTRQFERMCDDIFELVDTEKVGVVDENELYQGTLIAQQKLGVLFTTAIPFHPSCRSECKQLFDMFDAEKSGVLDKFEFREAITLHVGRLFSKVCIWWIATFLIVPTVTLLLYIGWKGEYYTLRAIVSNEKDCQNHSMVLNGTDFINEVCPSHIISMKEIDAYLPKSITDNLSCLSIAVLLMKIVIPFIFVIVSRT